MADLKISQLPALAEADLAAADELAVVDSSASETKRITAKSLVEKGVALIDAGSIPGSAIGTLGANTVTTASITDLNVTAAKIANNTITATQIAADAIGASELADNAVDSGALATNAVITAKITDLNVTADKLASNAVTTVKILDANVTYAKLNLSDGDIPGAKIGDNSLTATQIASNAIGSSELADNAVDTAAIANLAVTAAKIAGNTITAAQIANTTITGAKIANDTITATQIGANAIGASELADNAVDTAAIAASAVTNIKIADSTITYAKLNLSDGDIAGAKIASGGITSTQLAANSVTTSELADNAVDTAAVANLAITTDKLAANAVTGAKIANATIDVNKLANNTITAAKIAENAIGASELADGVVTSTHIAENSLTSSNLAANCIGSSELADSSVDAGAIQDNAVTTNKILDANVTTGKLAADAVTNAKIKDGEITPAKLNPSNLDRSLNVASGNLGINNAVTAATRSGITYNAEGLITGTVALVASDLPVATASAVGGVSVGTGLAVTGSGALSLSNSVTAVNGATKVNYNSSGQITGSSALAGTDLPVATTSAVGAIQITSGGGLTVDGSGGLTTSASGVSAGTYQSVVVNNKGVVTSGSGLTATQIPVLPAGKITSGTLDGARIGSSTIDATKLSNSSTTIFQSIAQSGFPTAQFNGQLLFDTVDEDAYIWDGTGWQAITTLTKGSLVFGGTYNAKTAQMIRCTAAGISAGLANGSNLPTPSGTTDGIYVVVAEPTETGTNGGVGVSPAPNVALAPPDYIIGVTTSSATGGSAWLEVDLSATIAGQTASNITFSNTGSGIDGIIAGTVQDAIEELATEKLAKAGGTFTGQLLIGHTGSLVFEGSSNDDFETTIAVANPTDNDKTITLPNRTGTVITSGDDGTVTGTIIADGTIENVNIKNDAAIALSKLATVTENQFLIGTASTGVITSVGITGDISIDNNGLAAIAAGSIIDADIKSDAEISGAKIVDATTSVIGVVQLTDSATSDSTTTAATPAAVKVAKLAADAAQSTANAALPKAGGAMTGDVSFNNNSNIKFYEATGNGSAYVGIKGAENKGDSASYTISLPAAGPAAGEVLKANASTPTTLEWASDTTTDSTKMPLTGSTFTGDVTFNDSIKAIFGSDSDLKISHTGTHGYVDNYTGNLYIRNDGANDDSDIHIQAVNAEESIVCRDDGSVELYHDGLKKFTTVSDGCEINSAENGEAILALIADEGDEDADYWRIRSQTNGSFGIGNYSTGAWVDGLTLDGSNNATFGGNISVNGGSNTTQATFTGTASRGLKISTEAGGAADEGVIFNAQASGTTATMKFQTNSATALTLAGNGGNATFEENLYVKGGTAADVFRTTSTGTLISGLGNEQRFTDNAVYSATSGTRKGAYIFNEGSTDGGYASLELAAKDAQGYFGSTILSSIATGTDYANDFVIQTRHASAYKESLRITSEGHATFAGNVTLGGGTSPSLTINASTHDASTANEAKVELKYNQSHANDSIGYIKLVENGNNSFDGYLSFGVPYNNSNTPGTRNDVLKLNYDNSATFAGTVSDSKGNLRSIPSAVKNSQHALVASDAGKCLLSSSGGLVVNNSVMSAGDAVTFINNSSSDMTITINGTGSGFSLYNGATGESGNKTLSKYGMATIWFAGADTGFISGAGLSDA